MFYPRSFCFSWFIGQQTVVLKIKDVGQVEPQPDEDGSSGKEQENVPIDITDKKGRFGESMLCQALR